MRIHLSLATLFLCGAALSAQTTYQPWEMHSGVTAFTSRGNIGSGTGEVLQGVHNSTNRGVLDVGGACAISRFSMITQDQNCATPESFDFVVRSGDDTNGPGTTTASILGSITGLNLPNSTTNGACAWNLVTTLTASTAIAVPCDDHWSYGLRLQPTTWASDGQSVHASVIASHNAHATAEDQAWQIIGAATVASNPSSNRAWRLTVYVADGAVMRYRCGGVPGYGGSFPLASTASMPLPWDAELNGGTNCASAASVVAFSVSRTSGIPIFGGANLYLGPFNTAVFFGPAADANGVAVIPLLPFVPASASGAGPIYGQGALDASGLLKLTNAQTIIP